MYGQTYIPAKARRPLKKFFVITGSGVRGDSGGGEQGKFVRRQDYTRVSNLPVVNWTVMFQSRN